MPDQANDALNSWDTMRGGVVEAEQYAEMIENSLNRLKEKYAFDLDQSLAAGKREFSATDVVEQAKNLADSLQLETEYSPVIRERAETGAELKDRYFKKEGYPWCSWSGWSGGRRSESRTRVER
ncbi:hypothetical protein FWF74_02125 [Candidatus Saccharibacteria bacterium]|nr:hypothetical protein [Candidatus Saccharibacteria bacterium]MCL1963246.1 hypothetical protein [Candidatus Saccharibacteria bacterium]